MRSEEKEKVGVGYYDYLFIFGLRNLRLHVLKLTYQVS